MRRAWLAVGVVAVLVAAIGGALLHWSGVSLAPDSAALAHVKVGTFGGSIESVRASGPHGRPIATTLHDGRLTPTAGVVAPDERVTVRVVVRRPGTTSWLLGATQERRLTLKAPAAHLSQARLTVGSRSSLRIGFDRPVRAVAYGSTADRKLASATRQVSIAKHAPAGTVSVASAVRPWERLGRPERVTWFPRTRGPALVTSPAVGSRLTPTTPLRLSFSKPVDDALGSGRPTITPKTPGSWHKVDDYTLSFTPSGAGIALGSHVKVGLPRSAALVGTNGALRTTRDLEWTVPPGSTLRLQQLLAGLGYLPLTWRATGAPVANTLPAQVRAAVDAPAGAFSWRYPNTPPPLKALWHPGQPNDVLRGAIVAFQSSHGLAADGFAGPQVWRAVLADTVAGKRTSHGYSYVYVHRDQAHQTLTLWRNGHDMITTPGNTGVAAAPTDLGTFPVFEHLAETTMKGSNPDGSHYSDPGIKWVSYFNGGDAIHAFDRASFGTPQSVGCVELPAAAAAKVWPYTPVGTLVTIEP